jgi:hypothetical protein
VVVFTGPKDNPDKIEQTAAAPKAKKKKSAKAKTDSQAPKAAKTPKKKEATKDTAAAAQ